MSVMIIDDILNQTLTQMLTVCGANATVYTYHVKITNVQPEPIEKQIEVIEMRPGGSIPYMLVTGEVSTEVIDALSIYSGLKATAFK